MSLREKWEFEYSAAALAKAAEEKRTVHTAKFEWWTKKKSEVIERDLVECQQKLMEHDMLIKAYDGWVQVLSAQGEARVRLNHDDWLFFFGK